MNVCLCSMWVNKGLRIIAGITFLLLMILINVTGNFGNLGIYTASICILLWAPCASSFDRSAVIPPEATSPSAIVLTALLAVPFLYVHVGLSMDALNSSITQFKHWYSFPALHL